jgi:hypothetical protein
MMDVHEELRNKVFEGQNMALCQWSKHMWRAFSYSKHMIGSGCEDEQPSRDARGEKVKIHSAMCMLAFVS